MSEIVVGYDGSDCAKTALDEAVALAKDLGRFDPDRLRLRSARPRRW